MALRRHPTQDPAFLHPRPRGRKTRRELQKAHFSFRVSFCCRLVLSPPNCRRSELHKLSPGHPTQVSPHGMKTPGPASPPHPHAHPAQMFPFSPTAAASAETGRLWRRDSQPLSSRVAASRGRTSKSVARAASAFSQNRGQRACKRGLTDPH